VTVRVESYLPFDEGSFMLIMEFSQRPDPHQERAPEKRKKKRERRDQRRY
jgi:hypothetical protein